MEIIESIELTKARDNLVVLDTICFALLKIFGSSVKFKV